MALPIFFIGNLLYIANAPIFSKAYKTFEYLYLIVFLMYVAMVSSNSIDLSGDLFLMITTAVYAPVVIKLVKKNS
ncbi:hypothetical protein [Terribacillus sp. DMT04]|uniref:hypothetical protein n=1 Tax=Terribacillus sp. DMT04 TaxID=2850441 RepID=UPI001C2CA072|nr:hypothetical protein [Terribacillus sp. DMT04]QXE03198.1 hypothetical protein KS242_08525 [Terribacillus sp. DMT04]